MEIYKSDGYRGRVYYVFNRKKNPDTAIIEAAHASKNSRENMTTIPVWVNGMDLYLEPAKGAIKAFAVVRKGKK